MEWAYFSLRSELSNTSREHYEAFIIANWVWFQEGEGYMPPFFVPSDDDDSMLVEWLFSMFWDAVIPLGNQEAHFSASSALQACTIGLPTRDRFRLWQERIFHIAQQGVAEISRSSFERTTTSEQSFNGSNRYLPLAKCD